MVEDGDGWYCGEPGSAPGFYDAHWACTMESPNGEFAVLSFLDGKPAYPDSEGPKYTTRKRATEKAEELARSNRPHWSFQVRKGAAVLAEIRGKLPEGGAL